ncbi:MAG: UpxY family transcription antiterminator [Acidobacteriaceae bacterium]|nr:UpxY family transcription antiterminator [Acidobacteriaceae bacterium]
MNAIGSAPLATTDSLPVPHPWYAIRTRSNHENLAAAVLEGKGYEYYLPKYRVRRRWTDRVVIAELPLFPGYVFCRFDARQRLPILTTPGVVSIIGFGNDPAPIAETEIAAIQTVLNSGFAAQPCPFLREGQRIRVKYGALQGLEGILLKKKADWRLVVSVTMLQRSIAVEVDSDSIMPL